jgi:hypothetical protein
VRCPQAPQAKQQQKKRTFDVLQNADSFTRYGQMEGINSFIQLKARRYRIGRPGVMLSAAATIALASMP